MKPNTNFIKLQLHIEAMRSTDNQKFKTTFVPWEKFTRFFESQPYLASHVICTEKRPKHEEQTVLVSENGANI